MFLLILKRLGLGLITIMLVSIIIFVGVEVLPGDACTAFLEREAKGELLQICKEKLGLIHQQSNVTLCGVIMH